MTDLLTALDNDARQSLTINHDIREAIIDAAKLVALGDGDFDYDRLRPWLPDWATGSRCGSTISGLVTSGITERVPGRYAELGNVKHRAKSRPTYVYRFVEES